MNASLDSNRRLFAMVSIAVGLLVVGALLVSAVGSLFVAIDGAHVPADLHATSEMPGFELPVPGALQSPPPVRPTSNTSATPLRNAEASEMTGQADAEESASHEPTLVARTSSFDGQRGRSEMVGEPSWQHDTSELRSASAEQPKAKDPQAVAPEHACVSWSPLTQTQQVDAAAANREGRQVGPAARTLAQASSHAPLVAIREASFPDGFAAYTHVYLPLTLDSLKLGFPVFGDGFPSITSALAGDAVRIVGDMDRRTTAIHRFAASPGPGSARLQENVSVAAASVGKAEPHSVLTRRTPLARHGSADEPTRFPRVADATPIANTNFGTVPENWPGPDSASQRAIHLEGTHFFSVVSASNMQPEPDPLHLDDPRRPQGLESSPAVSPEPPRGAPMIDDGDVPPPGQLGVDPMPNPIPPPAADPFVDDPLAPPQTSQDPQAQPQVPATGEPGIAPAETDRDASGRQNEPQTLGEAPEESDAPLQFLRGKSILLDPGEYEIDVELQYLISESDFVLAEIVGNTLQVAEVRRRQRLLLLPIEFRLGLTPVTQAFVNVPFGWSNSELAFAGRDEYSNVGGIGDVSAGITRQLVEGEKGFPDVLGTVAFSAPTGQSTFVTSLSTPGSSLGQGFWTLTAGLNMIHRYDPVVVFYGAGYRHRFRSTFEGDITVDPGKQIFYRLGVGYSINPRVTFSGSFIGSYITENFVNGVRIPGDIREPMQLRFATTIAKDKKSCNHGSMKTIEPYVVFGLTEDAIDSMIGISWTR